MLVGGAVSDRFSPRAVMLISDMARMVLFALLASAMRFLGHPVPAELRAAPLAEFWRWALANWSLARVPAVRGIFPGSA